VIVLDSSAWIEVVTAGPLGPQCRAHLESGETVIVPTVVIYEVYKIVRRDVSEDAAGRAAAGLQEGYVVPLDPVLAMEAAELSLRHGLSMADAIVYATAQSFAARLVTSDEHFADLPDVEYLPVP